MGMQARTELAIIDHNHNTDREQAVTAAGIVHCNLLHTHECRYNAGYCTGQLRYKLEYSKRTKKWVVKPIADHKRYDYLLDLMQDVIKLRLHGRDTTDILIEDPMAKDFPLINVIKL